MSVIIDSIKGLFDRNDAPIPAVIPPTPAEQYIELITVAQLIGVMPKTSPSLAPLWVEPLNEAMGEFEINTPARVAAFVAQIAHESNQLTQLEENLRYSAAGLRRTFPKYFTEEQSMAFAFQPEQIANRVYGQRMGNSEPGDGWKYRGRSPIMLTGRANYRETGSALDVPLEDSPDIALTPDIGSRIAGLFWYARKCNQLADAGDIVAITRAINGGVNGLADRVSIWNLAKEVMNG